MPISRPWRRALADVVVADVGSRLEADLVVGLLREYGIAARARVDDAGGMQPAMQLLGVSVTVAAADADEARAILASGFDLAEDPDLP